MTPVRKATAVTLAVAAVAALLVIQVLPPYHRPFGFGDEPPRPAVTKTVSVPGPTTTTVVKVPGPTKTVKVPGPTKTVVVRRTITVSRSLARAPITGSSGVGVRYPAPTVRTTATAGPVHVAATVTVSPQSYAASVLTGVQYTCLNLLFNRESGWNVYASNPSGAYGIPQALPGSKMATAGADWATNGVTQVRWGISYIDSVYGSPCNAWAHSQTYGWY